MPLWIASFPSRLALLLAFADKAFERECQREAQKREPEKIPADNVREIVETEHDSAQPDKQDQQERNAGKPKVTRAPVYYDRYEAVKGKRGAGMRAWKREARKRVEPR